MKRYLTLLVFFLINIVNSNATTCESTTVGDWTDNTIWDCGTVPSADNCVDTIIIGVNTNLDAQFNLTGCPPIVLIVNDTLFFVTGNKLYLPTGSQVIVHIGGYLVSGGGGGNSNLLKIGDDTFWNTGAGTFVGTSILDIELVAFYATQRETSVELNWTTASEVNNDFFTIERSRDGINFDGIGDKNGAANSSSEIYYSFLDSNVYSSLIYYRLKQTDFDGSTTTSQPIKISFIDDVNFKIFPNPAVEFFNIQGKVKGNVNIYTSTGILIQTIENYVGGLIPVKHFERGNYLVTFEGNGKDKSVKLVLK